MDLANVKEGVGLLEVGVVEALEGELQEWKRMCGSMLEEEKMREVAEAFEGFTGMFKKVVEDKVKDKAAREEWERQKPERDAQIAKERAAWDAQMEADIEPPSASKAT